MKRTLTFRSSVARLMTAGLVLSLLFLPRFSTAQDLPVVSKPVTMDFNEDLGYNSYKFMNDARGEKISRNLLAVMDMYENGHDFSDDPTVRVEGGKILIQAFAKSEAQAQDLLNSLEALGMTGGVAYKHVVNGMLPIDKIDNTTTIPSMRSLGFSVKPKMQVGSVQSQGDAAMGTDQIRTAAGVDGSGVKIGILSDAFNSLGGAAAGIASGNLPGPGNPNGYTTPVQVLSDLGGPGIDEGRAMAELVHDVAPGSPLAFHTAFDGVADFAQGIQDLRDAGCDMIVDDVFYFAQPYFQDDIIAQSADAVVADGAMYFSSAGNSANNSHDNTYNPGGFLFDFGFGLVYEPHDWTGGGDYFLQVTLPTGAPIDLWLQWDEPSLLAGLQGPEQDLDILVLNETLTSIISGSFLVNPDEGLPVEFIRGGNGGATPLVINIFVGRWAPTPGNPSRLKFIDFQSSGVGSRYEYPAEITKSTNVNQSKSEGAIAVGAAAYFNTPAFGVTPALINGFSSVGGTPVLFDPAGNRLPAPVVRQKPDITGPDGANTSFFFPGNDTEPDGFPNFFGTSASAPHVAALAALLRDAMPSASGPAIEKILKLTAKDMNDPRGVHSNQGGTTFDFATGYGFVDGLAALEAVKNIPTLSQWGLVLFLLLITGLGLSTVYSVKLAAVVSGGQVMSRPRFTLFFDRQLFLRKLPAGLLTIAFGAAVILLFWGELLAQDVVGLVMALPLVTYILHLVEVFKEDLN